MILKELQLINYRNYERQMIHLHPEVNLLIGENAQGKTNAIEAIYMLAIGKSYRIQKDAPLIRYGETEATIEGDIVHGQRNTSLRLQLLQTGRRAAVNGVWQARMTDFIGNFQVVLFAPEDLQLVKGSPSVRRRFLDVEIGQTYPKYLFHLNQFGKVMQQRNKILKSSHIDFDYLSIFDIQLVEHGTELLQRRIQFLNQLQPLSEKIYTDIAEGREVLTLSYVSTIPHFRLTHQLSKGEISIAFLDALTRSQQQDARFGSTSVGPHRDDIELLLDGRSVQLYASQGQQRTIALSLRLAEIELIHNEIGEYPVLLLDDVLSELDDLRQRNLVLSMSEKVQTMITSTGLFGLSNELQERARLFHVSSGIISR